MKTLNYEEREELDDKHLASADFIKEDVVMMVEMCSGEMFHTDKVKLFNLAVNIDKQLEDMWEAFSEYRMAYGALLEEYEKLTKQEEES